MTRKKTIISLQEAVTLLGVTIDNQPMQADRSNAVPTDVSDIYVTCPCCSGAHASLRRTLNLDFSKNLFNCPRCSFGGNVNDFIAYYTGWDCGEVTERIKKGELGETSAQTGVAAESVDVGASVKPLAPIGKRNDVYQAMLDLLTLSESHMEHLIRRGLSEEEIIRLRYRSTPTYVSASSLPKQLVTSGYDLRGVPGFGLDKKGNWSMEKTPSGFLVPGRNGAQLIQGFQIRADHPSDRIPKYGFFSSKKMTAGTNASTWCHWAGDNLLQRTSNTSFDVIIIEGWLKGDIAHFFTGSNFLCVPGVNSLNKAIHALVAMRKMGLRDVLIGYDMDAYENEQVAKQLLRLWFLLKENGYHARVLYWDKEFKGLDDWLLHEKENTP